MLEEAGLDRDALYYLCGPRGFAHDMAALLAELGVDASRVKREEW
jgi:ferredoxin-NADP reductase